MPDPLPEIVIDLPLSPERLQAIIFGSVVYVSINATNNSPRILVMLSLATDISPEPPEPKT